MRILRQIRDYWRSWRNIRATYPRLLEQTASLKNRVAQLERVLKERTTLHADIDTRGSYAILIGRYDKRDYVQTFRLDSESLSHLRAELNLLERHAHAGRINAPPGFKAVYDSELLSGSAL
jgi:hypothetical protein